MSTPVLYSFRRCPYAMRARVGLHLSALNPFVREIELKNKPAEMLATSAKGTVPILICSDGTVIAESIQIMRYAISEYSLNANPFLNDVQYQALLASMSCPQQAALIQQNDIEFKPWLDKYKYADRFPENSQSFYREQAESLLIALEKLLIQNEYLFTSSPTLADFAIFPFIRQFANVEPNWFDQCKYSHVSMWLNKLISSTIFKHTMIKYPLWINEKNNIALKQDID